MKRSEHYAIDVLSKQNLYLTTHKTTGEPTSLESCIRTEQVVLMVC